MADNTITILDERDKSDIETSIDNHAKTHWIKTYTNLSQIGLTEGKETIEAIATSLAANARLVFPVGAANANVYPAQLGTLVVDRINDSRVAFQFYKKDADRFWFGVYASDNSPAWVGWSEVYSEKHKPTAEDVGAVSKSGDTMNGVLRIENGTYPNIRLVPTDSGNAGVIEGSNTGIGILASNVEGNTTTMRGLYLRDSSATDSISEALMLMNRTNGTDSKYKIYGEHNKPKASDITPGSFSGAVTAQYTASSDLSNTQLRNISAGTSGMTAGSTKLNPGYIYLQYK